MTHSNALYKPSLLELAQAGNCQALTYWINSFLGPQGIHVRVLPTSSQFLKIVVDFQHPQRRETCISLRDRLVRFICYRLWVLNSDAIGSVRIVARQAGNPNILWQQSIRINSPVNTERVRRSRAARSRYQREIKQFRFQVIRSLFLSSMTLTGFFLGYWFFYVRLLRGLGGEAPKPTPPSNFSPPQYAFALSSIEQSTKLIQSFPKAPAPAPPDNLNITVPQDFQGKVVSQVDIASPDKVIALTFDDGPWETSTDEILNVLKRYNIKATFFMVGNYLKQRPEVARRVVAEGHVIGNHSWSHPLQDISVADAVRELDDTAKVIYETTGVKTQLFRPPGGRFNGTMAAYAKERGYAITMWSVESADYYVSAPILLDNVLKDVRPGRIVLMHDGGGDRLATVQALPQIISTLQQQGYRFVTVPELMKLQQKPNNTAPLQEMPKPESSPLSEAVEALVPEDYNQN